MTKRKIRSCTLSFILSALGSAAAMADSGELGHVPVLYGITSSAYQVMDDQNMNQIRGSRIDAVISAGIDADVTSYGYSGAVAAGVGAAVSLTGTADADGFTSANADGSSADATAYITATADGPSGRVTALTLTRTIVVSH